MQRLAEAVRTRWPSFVQFHPASPLPWIELNDDDLQVQFTVYDQTASITVPYFRERTDELMEWIGCCLRACLKECGYVAYDPQLGRAVTIDDLYQIAQLYRSMDNALPVFAGSIQRPKPWWKFW